jgi:hypothetical protein
MNRRPDRDKPEVCQASPAFNTSPESILVVLISANARCRIHDRSLASRSD